MIIKRYRLLLATMITMISVTFLSACSRDEGTIGHLKKKKPVPENARRVSGARKALMDWHRQRAYPGTVLSSSGFMKAFEQTQLMKQQKNNRDDDTDPWELIGPKNIGGRTLCLALHPDNPGILYAGSASGGLWKSVTGGVGASAWEYVDTGHPVLGVSHIAFDPNDSDIMYIGTGEVYQHQNSTGGEVDRTTRGSYGIGILKSSDGGNTWEKSLDWSYQQNRGIWMIAVHPVDSNIVYTATSEGVYKSYNAGDTWENIHPVIMATDIRIHPVDHNTLFVACGNFNSVGNGIYKSTNGGDDWVELEGGLPDNWQGKAQLAIAQTDPSIIYASIANVFGGRGLWKSTDTGDTWTQVSSTNYQQYQGWYSHYVIVSPFDEDLVFVGGIEIWRSTTGGSDLSLKSDWTEAYFGTPPPEGPIGGPNYAHADHHYAVWHPTDPDTIFFASDGGVFKTTDGGENFESLIGGYVTTQFYNGFNNSATDPDIAIGGMQDNFTAIYQGGPAWKRVIGGDGCWAAVDSSDPATLYGSYQYLGMQRSFNGGDTFIDISPPEQAADNTAFVAPFVLSPSDPGVLYAGRSIVYRSENQGRNWTATHNGAPLDSGNTIFAMDISHTSSDIVYAATAPIDSRGRVFVTRNAGDTWTDITGNLPDLFPSDITISAQDTNIVYITFMGYENAHVFRSDTGGATWYDVSAGLPDVPASAVTIDPADYRIVYVGTDLGVFVSSNSGQSWEPFMTGMPTAMVTDLKVFEPDRLLRAATHGNGVFQRDMIDNSTPPPTATPTSSGFGVRLNLADGDRYFTPGETFSLTAEFANNGPDRTDVPFFCILQVYDTMFFYPSWKSYPPDIDWENLMILSGNSSLTVLPEFTWPDAGGPVEGITFYAALLTPDLTAIDGDWDAVEWGYGPGWE
jgi:photosystem II stability/assembly factor-like uncharacterized protein